MTITLKFSLLAFISGLLLPVTTLHAGTASQDVKFKATFYGGGCEISVPAAYQFNNGVPITHDSIVVNSESLEILLNVSNCDGYFMQPKITVSGTKSNMQGTQLFADTSSTSKGYGILLSTAGNTGWSASSNLAQNAVINAKNWPAAGSSTVASLNGDLKLNAKLTCGACTIGPTLYGGNLKSTLTFTIAYQ